MKLFVFMLDALCSSDIEFMKTLPNFEFMFREGSYVKSILPVYPALTYCCHTSIVTGTYVGKHTITHNEILKRGGKLGGPWHAMRKDIVGKTFLDLAKEAGMSTCSISWPVTGGADYDYNMPMIVPYSYKGYHPEEWLKDTATSNLMDKYFWKYGRYIKGEDRSLDLYTMALAPDIIKDFGQPDVMLVKMCDLDSIRHTYGVYHDKTKEQLRKHDEEFGVLIETIKRYGDFENTNFAIIGDHGQTDVEDVLYINKLLADNGFIELSDNGDIKSYDALGHSTGLACLVELKDPSNKTIYNKVKDYLLSLKDHESIKIKYVIDAKEAKEMYGLEGSFDFAMESEKNITFSESTKVTGIWGSCEPGDHKIGAATHGSRPDRQETTTMIACGPAVRKGVVVECKNMVDEASTFAKMLGLEMPNTDGNVIEEILK